MDRSRPRLVDTPALAVALGAAAVAVGSLVSVRLDPGQAQNLWLGALMLLLAPLLSTDSGLGQAETGAILVAAGLAIAAHVFRIDSLWIAPLIGVAIGVAIAIPMHSAGLDALVPGSAAAMFALLLVAPTLEPFPIETWSTMIPAAIAALAAGSAIALFRITEIASWPATFCHTATSLALIGVSLGGSRLWMTSAILLTGATVLIQAASGPRSASSPEICPPPGAHALVWAIAGLAAGTAALFVTVALGDDLAWQMTGTIAAGILGLGTFARRWWATNDRRLQQLDRAILESRTDALTGLLNRRGIEERLDEEVARAMRYGHALAVLMIDLDNFKSINDRSGHAAGDHVLRSTSRSIERSIRSIDIASRYGGEEFLVLLPETGIPGAEVVAERIRSSVERSGMATVSIGLSSLAEDAAAPAAIIEHADDALYRAKHSGKNRVALAG
ncbi:MAG TPA: GGDEF domain-containing protein [Thermomicrobiales bacterium]|nr:GGDEF domain-containing protein [Thermomicrobiales bacterium]